MRKIVSKKMKKSVALNALVLEKETTEVVKKSVPRDFIFMCDVSYSMYGDLPEMRTQLKNKITTLLNPEDTITIIWFSGRGQVGVLQERVKVSNPVELDNLKKVIDRYLVPVGATSFLDPLELTEKLLEKKPKDVNTSVIFLTDGYNNSSPWNEVIKALGRLSDKVESATLIEYGYYANSSGLVEMAEEIGGQKIFASDFESYEIQMENIFRGEVVKRRAVDIQEVQEKSPLYGAAFSYKIDDTGFSYTLYSLKQQEILVSEDVEKVFFFTRNKAGEESEFSVEDLLTSILVLSDKLKYSRAEEVAMTLGDKSLLDLLSVSYGKQKLNLFKERVKFQIQHKEGQFTEGKDESYSPNPKRFCFMDLIDILQEDEKNEFLFLHEKFNYNRIGAKSKTKVELSEEQLEDLKKAGTKAQVDKVMSSVFEPTFSPTVDSSYGNKFSSLVWNEDRANLSVTVKTPGEVEVGENPFGLKKVPSFIYRSYTFVKDGILNVTEVPVRLSQRTLNKLQDKEGIKLSLVLTGGRSENGDAQYGHILDISDLPIVNKSMTVNISGKKLGKLQLDLIKNQIETKYYKYLNNIFSPKTNTESEKLYSKEAADWLQSIGVTDYNGFSPKREKIKSGDTYMASVLKVSVAGFSSIPKIEEALDYIKAEKDFFNKVEGSKQPKDPKPVLAALIRAVKEINIYPDSVLNEGEREGLSIRAREVELSKREILSQIAQIKFGLILSRNWFSEFDSMDDCSLILKDKILGEVKVKFESVEKEEDL